VPDDLDYAWLGSLVEHPEQWTEEDLAAARFMLTNQKRALDEAHPRDRARRQSLQETVDALEAAIEKYVASGAIRRRRRIGACLRRRTPS
jgi:hypothetical protein